MITDGPAASRDSPVARRKNKMTKTERLYIRVTPELKEKIQKAAEAENRTISAWLETMIKSKFAEKDK